jgi:hypothetical protein
MICNIVTDAVIHECDKCFLRVQGETPLFYADDGVVAGKDPDEI